MKRFRSTRCGAQECTRSIETRSAHPTRPFGAFHEDLLMRAEPGDARRERASPAARQMLIATGPASGV
ncbi:hypothetical protein WS45_09085 [Burkholderia sp. RF2-non_BP3]|nr:hypothetical protein WS45_09085 [Burkholderia sp. RF2-non_BP3]